MAKLRDILSAEALEVFERAKSYALSESKQVFIIDFKHLLFALFDLYGETASNVFSLNRYEIESIFGKTSLETNLNVSNKKWSAPKIFDRIADNHSSVIIEIDDLAKIIAIELPGLSERLLPHNYDFKKSVKTKFGIKLWEFVPTEKISDQNLEAFSEMLPGQEQAIKKLFKAFKIISQRPIRPSKTRGVISIFGPENLGKFDIVKRIFDEFKIKNGALVDYKFILLDNKLIDVSVIYSEIKKNDNRILYIRGLKSLKSSALFEILENGQLWGNDGLYDLSKIIVILSIDSNLSLSNSTSPLFHIQEFLSDESLKNILSEDENIKEILKFSDFIIPFKEYEPSEITEIITNHFNLLLNQFRSKIETNNFVLDVDEKLINLLVLKFYNNNFNSDDLSKYLDEIFIKILEKKSVIEKENLNSNTKLLFTLRDEKSLVQLNQFFSTYNLLVIDDEIEEFNKIKEIFKDYTEIDLFYGSNLQESIKILSQYHISAIALDVYWGEEKEGLNILRSLRTQYPFLPVFLLSSRISTEEIIEIIFNGGINGFCSKGTEKISNYLSTIKKAMYNYEFNLFKESFSNKFELISEINFSKDKKEIYFDVEQVIPTDSFFKVKGKRGQSSEKKFIDIKGNKYAKQRLGEWVNMIKFPWTYHYLGIKIPTGLLLYGPPGTGKTLLAEALANECGVNFVGLSAASLSGRFVGSTQEKIRGIFVEASKKTPCILFIDEVDAIARGRVDTQQDTGGAVTEFNNITTELLNYLDGYNKIPGIFVVAATNKLDNLDPAFTRPGRFDILIEVPLPDFEERKEILQYYLANRKCEENIDLNTIARITLGFSGADLENLVNEAGLLSIRKNKEQLESEKFYLISNQDIIDSVHTIGLGPTKEISYNEETRKRTAIHESGHTLMAYLLNILPKYVSILPRAKTLGFSLNFNDSEDYKNKTKVELLSEILIALAGRESEKIFYKNCDTGSYSDLLKVNKLVRDIYYKYAFSEEFEPFIPINEGLLLQTGEVFIASKDLMEDKMLILLKTLQEKCYKNLFENKDFLEQLSENLLIKENLQEEEILNILKNVNKFNKDELGNIPT